MILLQRQKVAPVRILTANNLREINNKYKNTLDFLPPEIFGSECNTQCHHRARKWKGIGAQPLHVRDQEEGSNSEKANIFLLCEDN